MVNSFSEFVSSEKVKLMVFWEPEERAFLKIG